MFNLQTQQLDYPGDDPVRPLKKDNFGPRLGLVYRLTDKTIVSSGFGIVWIEMAGITTPFTTPTFPFLQTVSQRALDTTNPAFVLANGPTVAPIPLTPSAGLGQGVFAVDGTLGSGYVATVECGGPARADHEHHVRSRLCRIEYHSRRHPRQQHQSADGGAAGAPGSRYSPRSPIRTTASSRRSSSLGDPTTTVAQLLRPYPAYQTVSLYRNNVGTTRYNGLEMSVQQRLSHGLSYSVMYTRSKLVDDASSVFDASILTGPIANYPVADSFNRALERDDSTGRHSERVRVLGALGHPLRRQPRASSARRAGRDRQRLERSPR